MQTEVPDPTAPKKAPSPLFSACPEVVWERAEEGVFHPLFSGLVLVGWTLLTPTPSFQFRLPQSVHLSGSEGLLT